MTAGNESDDLADVALELFDFTTRTRNCLINESISTVGQLAVLTASDVMRWQNAGRKTLRELRELLGLLGLQVLRRCWSASAR